MVFTGHIHEIDGVRLYLLKVILKVGAEGLHISESDSMILARGFRICEIVISGWSGHCAYPFIAFTMSAKLITPLVFSLRSSNSRLSCISIASSILPMISSA